MGLVDPAQENQAYLLATVVIDDISIIITAWIQGVLTGGGEAAPLPIEALNRPRWSIGVQCQRIRGALRLRQEPLDRLGPWIAHAHDRGPGRTVGFGPARVVDVLAGHAPLRRPHLGRAVG